LFNETGDHVVFRELLESDAQIQIPDSQTRIFANLEANGRLEEFCSKMIKVVLKIEIFCNERNPL